MRIHNLVLDTDGASHFRDIEIEWLDDPHTGGRVSKPLPGGLVIHEHTADYTIPRHPAPRRQYVLGLSEAFEITTSDGVQRRIAAGELVLVEDIGGKGHTTRSIGGGVIRYTLIFPVRSGLGACLAKVVGRLRPRTRQ